MAADYSIWVLGYARTKVSGDFMGGSPIASNTGTFEIPMLYTLVVSAPGAREPSAGGGAAPSTDASSSVTSKTSWCTRSLV